MKIFLTNNIFEVCRFLCDVILFKSSNLKLVVGIYEKLLLLNMIFSAK